MPSYSDFVAALRRERTGGRDVGYVFFDEVARQLTGADRSRAEAEIVRLVEAGDTLVFDLAVELDLAPAIRALERLRDAGDPWQRRHASAALARRVR